MRCRNIKIVFTLILFVIWPGFSFAEDQNDFFSTNDIFKRMEQMHREMEQMFDERTISPNSIMGSVSSQFDINQREDSLNKYVDITGTSVTNGSLNVDVRDGMIVLSSSSQTSDDSSGNSVSGKSYSYSSSSQSIPVPDGVDLDKVSFSSKDQTITIKFPKKIY